MLFTFAIKQATLMMRSIVPSIKKMSLEWIKVFLTEVFYKLLKNNNSVNNNEY